MPIIKTTYLNATDTRGSRIRAAFAPGYGHGALIHPYNHNTTDTGNHIDAANELANRFNLTGEGRKWFRVATRSGWMFIEKSSLDETNFDHWSVDQ